MPPPDTGRAVPARHAAQIARQHAALDAFVAQMRVYAEVATEKPPAVRAAIEGLLQMLHAAFLPPPPPPKTRRGRPPAYRDQAALLTAMEAALAQRPSDAKFPTMRALEPLMRLPNGDRLWEGSLEYNLRVLHVSWKRFKADHKKP